MSSTAALFQILYQNETLFQLNENRTVIVQEKEHQTEKSALVPAAKPKTILPTIKITDRPETVTVSIPATQEFPELKHKILILTEVPQQQEMREPEAIFLDNILKAVKFSIHDADIFNFSFLPPTDASSVFSKKKTHYFISFGVPLIKLNVDQLLVPYTPKQANGMWLLLADPLTAIEANRDLKRKLWQALQKMFENA
jgi:hypothetical protein